MIKTFQSHTGMVYSLNESYSNNAYTMKKYDDEYAAKAHRLAREQNCNVFYSLKRMGEDSFKDCQYFIIPVDAYDTEIIANMFPDHLVGIAYAPCGQYLPFSMQEEIRSRFVPMTGIEYEELCAEILRKRGFQVTLTKASGDQGIDIIAWRDGIKYGIQCKYYKGSVPNKAVQEAYSGARFYDCDRAAVMTNSELTASAKELAAKLNVDFIKFEGNEP